MFETRPLLSFRLLKIFRLQPFTCTCEYRDECVRSRASSNLIRLKERRKKRVESRPFGFFFIFDSFNLGLFFVHFFNSCSFLIPLFLSSSVLTRVAPLFLWGFLRPHVSVNLFPFLCNKFRRSFLNKRIFH